MSAFTLYVILLTSISTHAVIHHGSFNSIQHQQKVHYKAMNNIAELLVTKQRVRLLQSSSAPTTVLTSSKTPTPAPTSLFDTPSFMSIGTDNSVCEEIMATIDDALTEYARNQKPCKCRPASDGSDGSDGKVDLSCNYDYCEECLEGSDLCGTQETRSTYQENAANTGYALPEEINTCIQHTRGRNDKVCLISLLDYTTLETTCSIQVGNQTCNKCELTKCGTTATTATSFGDVEVDSGVVFDCTNIANGSSLNLCEYVPFTRKELPPVESNDPVAFLHHSFQSCLDPTSGALTLFRPTLSVAALSGLWIVFGLL